MKFRGSKDHKFFQSSASILVIILGLHYEASQ